MRVNTLSPVRGVAIALLCAACGNPGPSTQQAKPVPASSTPTGPAPMGPPAVAATPASPASPAAPAPTLARVKDDLPLALPKLLGHSVAEVQAQLGDPLGKGMARDSCVRYVPERVFFACKYAQQSYADKTGNFAAVRVGYEDGVATEVAYDGWKGGTGAFTPEALLAGVGLELPEAGKQSSPADKVKLWAWFNGDARLVIGGKQHRVEVSIIDDDWARTRVDVLENDRLTPDQQARARTPAPQVSATP